MMGNGLVSPANERKDYNLTPGISYTNDFFANYVSSVIRGCYTVVSNESE